MNLFNGAFGMLGPHTRTLRLTTAATVSIEDFATLTTTKQPRISDSNPRIALYN